MSVVASASSSTSALPASTSLPTSGRAVHWIGIAIVLIAFGGFGAWAVLASLSVTVVASGTVSVESFKKTVQHLEGGIVSRIDVDDGDRVEQGQTLMVLDNTQSQSQLEIAQAKAFTAGAQKARLIAEQQGKETLTFPPSLVEQASGNVEREQTLAVQRSLFVSRRSSQEGELGALAAQSQQFREQIEGLEQNMAINRERITSLNAEADDYRSLFRAGLGNNQRIRELERQVMQYRADSAESKAQIAQLRSRISENTLRAQVQRQNYHKDVNEQLREAQSQLESSREKAQALSDRVRRTTITAPVAGTVVGLTTHTIGAVIEPGKPVMHIVPSSDGFMIEARIPAQEVDNVYPGAHANIRFSAFNQRRVPVMDGVVRHVSADSFEDESTGVNYYKARVDVSPDDREALGDDLQLLSGMPAEVMIETGQKTLAEYLLQPVTDMLRRALRQD
ncbi:HlyD family type I secretion periplasmic adaptor subunit [Halomonas elongata]|uniref:HlyD family type I secretion periplasmic adaptor subunit n=1 Tax=Halomonas elongata TaxID=2746 RepID=UPI0038D3B3E8